MDLSVKKTQTQRDAAAPAMSQPAALPEGARNAFAAVLQKATGHFGGNLSVPFAPGALKARFDRPAPVEQPDRRAPVDRGDNRARVQDNSKDNRSTERAAKPEKPSSTRDETRAADSSQPQRTKEPEKAKPERADASGTQDQDVAVRTDAPDAASDDAAAPVETQVSETGNGSDTNVNAVQVEAPKSMAELASRIVLQMTVGETAQDDVLIGSSANDALKQNKAAKTAGNAPAKNDAAAAGNVVKQDDGVKAGDVKLDMTMVGPETATPDSDVDLSMFKLQLQAAANGQQASVKGAADTHKATAKTAASKSGDAAREQASDLSQVIGDDKKMSVKVAMGASALSSLPQTTATLVPSAALMGSEFQTGMGGETPLANGNGQNATSQNAAGGQGANNPALNHAGLPGAQVAQTVRAEAATGPAQSFSDALKAAAVATESAGPAQTATQSAGASDNAPQLASAQGPGQAGPANQTEAARQAQAPRPNIPPQHVTEQVKVSIDKAIAEGADEIKIQLRPESLGGIEVKLELSSNHQVHAVITADRPETLELLKQDARGLEKALQDAGLKADGSSLSFNLRGDQEQQAMAREGNGNGGNGRNGGEANGGNVQTADPGEVAREAAQSRAALRGGVDVRI
ncbi:MAG: flagellar hook-length control protein FliK [Alphaproteobacteria bacterium]|nr:flagellar hook-length control protein FliK [Alphaproteobacteria bacterium]